MNSKTTPRPTYSPEIQLGLDAPYQVGTEQRAIFDQNGYVRLRGVMDPEVLLAYEPAISATLVEQNTMHLPMAQRSTYHKAFLQVTNARLHNEAVMRFVLGKRLAGIAANLLGVEAVRLYSDQALYKEAGGGITPWHADQYYWPISNDRSITVWIPLQDTPSQLGPLEFARGSQHLEYGRGLKISDESEAILQAMLTEGDFPTDHSPYSLGDVSYHLGWTFHRASPNTSDSSRRVMTIVYVDADIRVTPPLTDEHVASITRILGNVPVGSLLQEPMNPRIDI